MTEKFLELKIIQYLNKYYKDLEFNYVNLSEPLEIMIDSDFDIDRWVYYPLIIILFNNKSKFIVFYCSNRYNKYFRVTVGETIDKRFVIKKELNKFQYELIFDDYTHTNINSFDDFLKSIKNQNKNEPGETNITNTLNYSQKNLSYNILQYLKSKYELKFIDFDLQKTKEVNIEYSTGDKDYETCVEIPDFYIKIEFDIFSIDIKRIEYYQDEPILNIGLLSDNYTYSSVNSIEELESEIERLKQLIK